MRRVFQWIREMIWLWKLMWRWFAKSFNPIPSFGRRKQKNSQQAGKSGYPTAIPKPAWVKQEIIRLKAFMPREGCRTIAQVFNRLHQNKRNMTVGKTYVYYTIRDNLYEIQVLRKKIKNRQPRDIAKNRIWGMDLTGKQDTTGKRINILGIVEFNSRAALSLKALKDKTTLTLLRTLLDTIEKYEKPKIIRADNEAVFNSKLFSISLWVLGIRHQRIEQQCPWQNGRVERFFGTLKNKLDQWEVDSRMQLSQALAIFSDWYNFVRPHQNLDGRTPAEVWLGQDVFSQKAKDVVVFEAWDGLLKGYYLRL